MARILLLLITSVVISFCPNKLSAQNANNSSTETSLNYYFIQSKIIDASTTKALSYATISVLNSNISTVSNSEGEFSLKIPKSISNPTIEIKYLGYKTTPVNVATWEANKSKTIGLQPETIQLTSAVIKPGDAVSIMKQALSLVKNNYSIKPYNATAFYRETVKKNTKYLSLAEAVLDLHKTSYLDNFEQDAATIYKGRKSSNISPEDTILFKYQGGINTAIMLDVVKYFNVICSEPDINIVYDFTFADNIVIDGREHYVIQFNQKRTTIEPLYRGKFFIDVAKLAISQVEFNMNVEGNDKASEVFILQKPRGTKFTMESAAYLVSFLEQNGTWYYNYSRAEIKFRCKREGKRLFNFSTTGTIMSEIAITDRNFNKVAKIPNKLRVRSTDILVEKLSDFTDQDFWGEYNVIEPDQSIDSAVKRLKKTLQKREKDNEKNGN